MGIGRYAPELLGSGLGRVVAAFASLVALNLATLALGTTGVIARLNTNPAGALLSPFVFDSWGTIGGLAGVVLLFAPLLFGTPVSQRRALATFFLTASIVIGVSSAVLWDRFYDTTGLFGSGASAIAVTSQGIIFALAIVGLLRLARQETRRLGALSSHWWYSFAIIYSTLILTSLWFILVLEPIFIPTTLYNWRVHEFGFVFGAAATAVFAGARWRALGLDGVVRIDEMVMNFHFDDLSGRFPARIPKYHVLFWRVDGKGKAELHPERGEIWVSDEFREKDYAVYGPLFEKALLNAMVQADLLAEGKVPEDGKEDTARRFDEVARLVGASPEP
ncbi:MAG: hypothetical protein ABSG45_01820 [Nitrososphaerales archaeon]